MMKCGIICIQTCTHLRADTDGIAKLFKFRKKSTVCVTLRHTLTIDIPSNGVLFFYIRIFLNHSTEYGKNTSKL